MSRGLLLPAVQGVSWLVFLSLWAIIGISDFRHEKILHRDLRTGLAFAGVCYGMMAVSTILGGLGWASIYYEWPFYRDLALHAAMSAAVSLLMWQARIWPAGDAKLFILLALVFPMMPTLPPFQSGWQVLSVLVNIFIPASVAVFFMAARHVWVTRLRHAADFMETMGLPARLAYAGARLKAGVLAAAGRAKEDLLAVARSPTLGLRIAASWIMSMALMSLLSCALAPVVPSPTLRTLMCFGFLLLWSRVNELVGTGVSWGLAGALAGAAALGLIPVQREEFLRALSYVSVFSIFLNLGIKWTMGAAAGQWAMLAFPFIGLALGLIPMALSSAWRQASALAVFAPLAALGLFFGLAFVFVKIWDNEDHPDVLPENVVSFMVLHHTFLKRLREDKPFFREHFGSVYADGLTSEQAEAVRGWCQKRSVKTVPLTATIPFSHWIFLGYFLTWLAGGPVLQWLR